MTVRKRLTEHGIMPGDLPADKMVERIVRVDHAGEYGAVRIYQGQLSVLGDSPAGDAIRHMAEQEREHLETFDGLIAERRVRPTALMPVWHVAGYALGAATAMMGERAAMACTAAVEEVIDKHYAEQAALLGDDEADLRATIEKFREDELEHRDTALEHDAELAPGYEVLSTAIKKGSRLAIWLSQRV
jgi:ubiquinone biosynthesis monooxygenase Coq7